MEETVPLARRVSPFWLVIIMIILVLSLAAIYQGVQDYVNNRPADGGFYLTIGVSTLAISTYLLFQIQRRPLRLGLQTQPMNTTLLCEKCGFRNVRDFQRGDYVLKHMEEPCPRCNEKTVTINSIFREVKEKTKETGYS